MRTKLLFSALAVAALAVPACGGSTASGPIITAITVTDSPVPVNTDGSYTIDLTINFTDDVDVDTFFLDCTNGVTASDDIHTTGTVPATAAGQFTMEVTLPNGTATGTYSCQFSLEDVNNLTSATFQADFTLE